MKEVFIGIDVSKLNLDLCVLIGDKISQEVVISNTISEITKFFKSLLKKHPVSEILVCSEHSGHYTYPLSCVCADLKLDFWLANPYHLKHSLCLRRGKNDSVDARRIAEYCARFQDKAKLYSLPDAKIASLKILLRERDLYMSHKSTYQGQLTDQQNFMSGADFARKSERLQGLVAELDENISAIDKEIEKLIESDETLSNQKKLLCSVDGVSHKLATVMLVFTNSFSDFVDGRSFCCYAGLAPFDYISGSSIFSKMKVSHKANKYLKSLLHLGALSAAIVKKEGELREYYLRKVAEGKNKMSMLNAIRAKIVLRMFAVIKENRQYEKNYQHTIA